MTTSSGQRRTAAIVMAGGLGTRMRSRLPKVLHPLLGRPMLAYVIDAASTVTEERPVVVFSPATEAVRERFADVADFALQAEPLGTGDALRAGMAAVADDADEVLVVSGDVPRVQTELLAALIEARRLDEAVMTLVAVETFDPTGLGRVVRTSAGSVDRIVEEKDATDDERDIAEINGGVYAFDAAWLREHVDRLSPS
ncbi:MAG TPA: NTP transferase domain-containing protein, partial [Candidatus Limnocylindrales bacterium]|nr:NTP transferase domain-containing protein [Candidatus Limnocylindrales bacterium]